MRARQRHLKPKSIGAFIALDSRYINQSDNTAISQWDDISGSGNNATQATVANQPVYRTNVLGGNGVVRPDGTTDFLESPTISKSQPYTSFVIAFLRKYSSSFYNDYFPDTSLGCFSGTSDNAGVAKYAAYAGSFIFSAASSLNTWFLQSSVFNTTSSKIAVNGGTATTGNVGSTNLNGKFRIGLSWAATVYFDNDTALGMVCEGALSDALRKRIERSYSYSFKLACS